VSLAASRDGKFIPTAKDIDILAAVQQAGLYRQLARGTWGEFPGISHTKSGDQHVGT